MGNHLSRSLLLPHPSNTTIYQATLRSNLLEASAVLRLLFIDPATGYKRHFFLDRDASLTGALEVFAWKIRAPVGALEMRVRGEVVREGVTAEELALKDGAKIKVSRHAATAVDVERPLCFVQRNNPEMSAVDEERARAMVMGRFERKCRITREALGIL